MSESFANPNFHGEERMTWNAHGEERMSWNAHGEGRMSWNAYFSSKEIKINTLEESLSVLDMPFLLQELDKSLEDVRRNMKTENVHRQYVKSANKKLLKLSQYLHPDLAMNRRESDDQIAKAHKLQTTLNSTRTVLDTLTDAFLKYIDIDYKYVFFSKLEICSMLNEKERDHIISYILYKISELSEIKRLKIVGEIRKFLEKCRRCISSYLDHNKYEFKKYRDYALLHLKKCIEGYKNVVVECALLKEECRDENEENVRSVIQKIAEQSKRESIILGDLQMAAESSLEGTFQVFSIYGPTDEYEYFILPFVYYVNVLLMCSVIIDKKTNFKFNFFQNFTTEIPHFGKEPVLFLKAFHLASNYNNKTQYRRDVELILMKRHLAVTKNNIVEEFDETLVKIDSVLKDEFKIEAYNEGKSNREIFYEKLLQVNDKLVEIEKIKKNLQEEIRLCKKENEDVETEYYEITQRTEEMELEKQKNFSQNKKTSEEIAESVSNWNENATPSKQFFLSENLENERQSFYDMEVILDRSLEQYKIIAQDYSKLLKVCEQNITEQRTMFKNASSENWNKYPPIISEEIKKKIQVNLKLNNKIGEKLSKLLASSQNIKENTKCESREILLKDQQFEEADNEDSGPKIEESVDPCGKHSSENQNRNSLINSELGPRSECLCYKPTATEHTKLFLSENHDILTKRLKIQRAYCNDEEDDKSSRTLKENGRMHQSKSQAIMMNGDRGSKKGGKHLKEKLQRKIKSSGSLDCDSCKLHTSGKSEVFKKENQGISVECIRDVKDDGEEMDKEINKRVEKNEFSKYLYGESSILENIIVVENENQDNLIKYNHTVEHDGQAVKSKIKQNESVNASLLKCVAYDKIIEVNLKELQTQCQEILIDSDQIVENDGTEIDK